MCQRAKLLLSSWKIALFFFFPFKYYHFADTLLKDAKQKLSTILSRNQIVILFGYVTSVPCPRTYSSIDYFLNIMDKIAFSIFSSVLACIFSVVSLFCLSSSLLSFCFACFRDTNECSLTCSLLLSPSHTSYKHIHSHTGEWTLVILECEIRLYTQYMPVYVYVCCSVFSFSHWSIFWRSNKDISILFFSKLEGGINLLKFIQVFCSQKIFCREKFSVHKNFFSLQILEDNILSYWCFYFYGLISKSRIPGSKGRHIFEC